MVKVWWRRISYGRADYGWLRSIALALVCVGVATLARMALGLLGSTLAFATFFPAVLVAALFGGRIAGLLAIPFSIVTVWWAFVEPYYQFDKVTPVQAANFILFTLSSLLVVALAFAHRSIVFDIEDKERERDLLVHELEHRNKNSLAVTASLIRQTITDKDEAEGLINRLLVAADNRDLLDDTASHETDLRLFFKSTMQKPYGGDRVALAGPDVVLNEDQARSLRIVFHELTTNALKYGALSVAKGNVAIDWLLDGDTLIIVWRENNGPRVSPPTKYSFGSKLITVTLKQMKATLEPTFAETGYSYKISFALA